MSESIDSYITWYVNVLKAGKVTVNLGYCYYGKEIAFISNDILDFLLRRDITIQNGNCIDGDVCLNLSCPYNRADPKMLGLNRDELQRMHNKLKEVKEMIKGAGHDFENVEKGAIVGFTKPLIIYEKKPAQEGLI